MAYSADYVPKRALSSLTR